MAKKTKEQEKKLFNLEEENSKTKLKKKQQSKKKVAKKEKKEENKEELFSFDHEIVIGVTKKEEPKKDNKKQAKNKQTTKNGKNKNKNQLKKKPQTKQIEQSNKKIDKKDRKNKASNNKQTVKKQNISNQNQEKLIKKRKKITFLIKYGVLAILLIIVVLCAMFSPLFNIKTIEVEGNEKIAEKEIISLSQIQVEQNTFKVSKSKVEKQIKQNAYINEVIVTRKLPSTIILKVEERNVAYLLEYAGSYVYLDKQGHMLEISTEKLELPILQGAVTPTADFAVGNRLVNEDLEKLSAVAKIMELAQINQINNLITRIDIENKQDLKLVFETKDKTAYLGDSTNLNTKILTIKSILEKEEGKAGEIFVNMDLNKENPMFRERV